MTKDIACDNMENDVPVQEVPQEYIEEDANETTCQTLESRPALPSKCMKYGASRRRSTIFQKKAIDSEDESQSPILTQEDSVQSSQEEFIPLDEYITKLREENDSWPTTYRERKRVYKNTSKLQPEILTLDSIAHLLSDTDKKFVSENPEYETIAKKVQELSGRVLIGNAMKRKADNLMSAVMRVKVKERLLDVEAKIVDRD